MYRVFSFFWRSLSQSVFVIAMLVFAQDSFAVLNLKLRLPKEKQQYMQAEAFHERLHAKYADLSDARVQTYYKKINPVVSKPDDGTNRWSFPIVIISEKKVFPGSDGTYRHGDISFKIHQPEKFDPTKEMSVIVACHNGRAETMQRCLKDSQTKELYLTRMESYSDLLSNGFIKGAFWRHKLRLKSILRDDNGKAYKIHIESTNERNNPIVVRGMAVVYNKKTEKTEIFFDFVGALGQKIDHVDPVFTCKHTKSHVDKKIFRIHQHKFVSSGCLMKLAFMILANNAF